MTKRIAWTAAVAVALVAACAPLPADAIERYYSRGFFPVLQHGLTRASNLVPIALFDGVWIGAIAVAPVLIARAMRRHGVRRGLARVLRAGAGAAVVVYLAFLSTWGLNYRRVPMFDKIVFHPERITGQESARLGEWAVAELNQQYAAAHSATLSLDALAAAFESAHQALGGSPIVPGRPKATLLGWYFHKASIAGMTDPFFLETLLAPDLLDVERPFVIAHEWAHLAGYADESEANFVAYLACRRSGAAARYSAGLVMIGYARPRRALAEALEIGPRSDLYAIEARYARTSGTLRFAAREGYDTYLKANRVERGIESYDAVVQLILGAEFDAQGNPRLR